MKTIYVIGAGGQEAAKRLLELKKDVEIVCVESEDDIPMSVRLSSDPSVIQRIYEIKAPPLIDRTFEYVDKKPKGYQRPYKYHR